MLDPKLVYNQKDDIEKMLKNRLSDIAPVAEFIKLYDQRKLIIVEVENLKNEKNKVSKEVGQLFGKMKATNDSSLQAEIDEKKKISKSMEAKISQLDDDRGKVEEGFKNILLNIPNTLHESVPIGKSEEENVEVKTWGTIPKYDFEPKPHDEVGEALGILDFGAAAKMSGARFCVYHKQGAQLERAIANFMLDLHTNDHGYSECITPYLVNKESMIGSAQFPKFEEDAFKVEPLGYSLIPTSEVSLVNLYRDTILSESDLPLYYTAWTQCFRAEAGSYGKDVKGLIRQHQFSKVELVKFVTPETSYEEHEKLLENAEKVLQLLELPYRVVSLCSGDIGFAAAKTYDIEVWIPSQNKYREISSCSNCEDYQARRANIRYRKGPKGKPEFLHTLNGSGLAVGRTLVAILENFQQKDGTVRIPEVLRKYMGGEDIIS